jgi:hypothetical protein
MIGLTQPVWSSVEGWLFAARWHNGGEDEETAWDIPARRVDTGDTTRKVTPSPSESLLHQQARHWETADAMMVTAA